MGWELFMDDTDDTIPKSLRMEEVRDRYLELKQNNWQGLRHLFHAGNISYVSDLNILRDSLESTQKGIQINWSFIIGLL